MCIEGLEVLSHQKLPFGNANFDRNIFTYLHMASCMYVEQGKF